MCTLVYECLTTRCCTIASFPETRLAVTTPESLTQRKRKSFLRLIEAVGFFFSLIADQRLGIQLFAATVGTSSAKATTQF